MPLAGVESSHLPKPIIKWAGGKSRLAGEVLDRLPAQISTYFEPFLGGAAVFFALARAQRFKRAVLSDVNRELVDVYRGVQNRVGAVVKLLQEHQTRHSKDHYYETRELSPNELDPAERAARFIYLNKTGYNGLYRVNRAGRFNVPLGRYTKPNICDEPRLRAASRSLKGVKLLVSDFASCCEAAEPSDAVYFDPPYLPVSKTASFAAYQPEKFDEEEHARLANLMLELRKRSVRAVLSNSDTEATRRLFSRRGFRVESVRMARAINSKSALRGDVDELLVSNGVRLVKA